MNLFKKMELIKEVKYSEEELTFRKEKRQRDLVRYAADLSILIKDMRSDLEMSRGDGRRIYLTKIAYDLIIYSLPENSPEISTLKKDKENYNSEIETCEKRGYSHLINDGIEHRFIRMIERLTTLEEKLGNDQGEKRK